MDSSGSNSTALCLSARHMPPQGHAEGHEALVPRELQLGPLPVSRVPSLSNSPARQDTLPTLGRAGRRQKAGGAATRTPGQTKAR